MQRKRMLSVRKFDPDHFASPPLPQLARSPLQSFIGWHVLFSLSLPSFFRDPKVSRTLRTDVTKQGADKREAGRGEQGMHGTPADS